MRIFGKKPLAGHNRFLDHEQESSYYVKNYSIEITNA